MTKILLGHLGSNGDCLYATTVARQIKHDFPGCHLTWAISSKCVDVIENNPDVDAVWEIPLTDWTGMDPLWFAFETEAWRRVAKREFDHAFMTQICPNYFSNYDGTIRPSIFRNYGKPITVPVETIISLTSEERDQVDEWANINDLEVYEHVILFECSSKSGQSFLTPAIATEIAERVTDRVSDACFILSTHETVQCSSPRILSGQSLTLRQTAHLTHYASLFVGCGSGVTVVATSFPAKENLPNIQILNRTTSFYASFKHDFEYFGKPSDHFLESTATSTTKIADMIIASCQRGFAVARHKYGETQSLDFGWYFAIIDQMLIQKCRYLDAAQSLVTTAERYGWTDQLRSFARLHVLPFIDLDQRLVLDASSDHIDDFRMAVE